MTSESTTGVVVTLMPTDPSATPDAGLRGRAYRLLMRSVAEVTGVPVAEVSLGREPAGRPVVVGPAEHAHVSLAHTPGLVVAAVSTDGHVGVDAEGPRQVDTIRLARRWLAVRDVRWLVSLPEEARTEAFLWLWTHKEALGKMAGIGLRGDSLRAEVPRPDPWRPAEVLPEGRAPELVQGPPSEGATGPDAAWLAAFRTGTGHQVALAVAASGSQAPPVQVRSAD
ncbi:MAG: 4'-phosphopantetheinyl transferase superfamily protein [Kineosporiaceae bacterium]